MEPSLKYLILTCTFLLILGILLVMGVEEHKGLMAQIPPHSVIIFPKGNYTYIHEYVVSKEAPPGFGLYASKDRVVYESRSPPSISKLWEYIYHVVVFKILDIKDKEGKIPALVIYPDNSTEKYMVGKGDKLLIEIKEPGQYKIILINPYSEALNVTKEVWFYPIILENSLAPLGLILVISSLVTMTCTVQAIKRVMA